MSDQFWRCMKCGYPDAGAKPAACPKCGGDVLFAFDNESNFMFRRMKWERKNRPAKSTKHTEAPR